MLNFTARGAVRTPTTLQIRIGAFEPGAMLAGAPMPSRSLSSEEITDNLTHFTRDRRTTRTQPCDQLVLSGCSDLDLSGCIREARSLGISRVTLHGVAPPPVMAAVDRIAVRVETVEDVAVLPDHPNLVVVLPLSDRLRLNGAEILRALIPHQPSFVSFRWPYPDAQRPPPSLSNLKEWVEEGVRGLKEAGLRGALAGLPACLSNTPQLPRRTRNRFYVDADHQRENALLFFPDIVRLAKPDTCRSCSQTAWCDGIARAWLDEGGVGLLVPIASPAPGG